MIQILNIIFHFHKILKIDSQEAKTKNKELGIIFEQSKFIIEIKKTREAHEYKAELQNLMKQNIGYYEIDFLEIFIWRKSRYGNTNESPFKTFLVKVNNANFDNIVHNNQDTVLLKFIQDQIDQPITLSSRLLQKIDGKLGLGKEKEILKFGKSEITTQKSVDLLHILNSKNF